MAQTQTTRRNLVGASAAALLIGCPAAGAAKAFELDGALLVSCAEFLRADAELSRLDRAPGVERAEIINACGIWDDAFGAVLDCPAPRTPEGIQAKARAAFVALKRETQQTGNCWRQHASSEVALALLCLLDVAGGVAA